MLSMLILAAVTSQPVVTAPVRAPANPAVCKTTGAQFADGKADKPVRAQKLNELPNADAYLTVLRIDEKGCEKPAIVAYDIGSAPPRQR